MNKYENIIQKSFQIERQECDISKEEYLECLFGLEIPEEKVLNNIVKYMVDICSAITLKKINEFINESDANRVFYQILYNYPFLKNKLGGNPFHAFWDGRAENRNCIEFFSTCLYINNKQECELQFTLEEWDYFIFQIEEFYYGALNG